MSFDFDKTYTDFCADLSTKHLFRQLPKYQPGGLTADFSSNDYLGLSKHRRLKHAASDALDQWGLGSTGSRLLSGNVPCHEALETLIAKAKGTQAALVFSSGYQANATVLGALLDKRTLKKEAVVFADRLNHSSLHHACRYAGVVQQRFDHNNMNHLESLLQTHAHEDKAMFIVAETVYGMDGDCADIDKLYELAHRFNAFLYLDEAHATGILGQDGYGLTAQRNNPPPMIAMGTFSKAIGCSGAYIACSEAVKNYLLNRCTGFVYSTAPPPAISAAVMTALKMLPTLGLERQKILNMAQSLRDHCAQLGLNTGQSTTHIVPIVVGDETSALQLKAFLLERGLLTSAVRPPTVPMGTARVRVALCSHHTTEQLNSLKASLAAWCETRVATASA
ncbi:MAG: 8-amino-7-oxononanoate synthase [Burkholderiales bacterium]|nr:8-amino-7-oxononanoate synthase [Burkholderiales bacterium]